MQSLQALPSPAAAKRIQRAGPSSTRSSPLAHAARERNVLEWVTEGATAATEVSRAVRERGVTAFDDSKSFVARGGGGEVRSPRHRNEDV
jgi:uncharacterized membrane-anchored protein